MRTASLANRDAEANCTQNGNAFRTAFLDSPTAQALYDHNGTLVEVNRACRKMAGGVEVAEWLGVELFTWAGLSEKDRRSLAEGRTVATGPDLNPADWYDPDDGGGDKGIALSALRRQITPLGWDGRSARNGYLVQLVDETERGRLESEREATLRVLNLLNAATSKLEMMKSVVLYLRSWTGCEAIGIRLKEGEDYPYYQASGFSDAFVLAENSLCARDSKGRILRDKNLNPVLDCMCGNILRGRFDPALPFFTEHGSFWSNCTTELLASTSEEERQARTRNRCNGEGYESVALVPLRFGRVTYGLLQMNDSRRGRFSLPLIHAVERLADHLAIGLSQRQTIEALRDNRERLEFVISGAGLGWWDWYLCSGRVSRSREWAAMLGYSLEEAQEPGLFRAISHPEDLERGTRLVEEHLNGLSPCFEYETRLRRKSGEYIWVLSRGRVVERDPGGRPLRASGTIQDITSKKQLDFEREKASRLESIGVLAGGIAHDFNNILTTALGNLSLARMLLTENPEEVIEILGDAEEALLRSKNLTQQLLTFAKGGSPVKKAFCIKDLLAETAISALRGTQISADLNLPDKPCPVEADEDQCRQMLANIVANAVQAMPSGGEIKVAVSDVTVFPGEQSVLAPGRYFALLIGDSGIGIHPDHAARVFDPYFTTKQTGSGLGLTTSYSIAKRHGGHIAMKTELGHGSEFTVYLPAAEEALEAKESREPAEPTGSLKILVMDDERGIRTLAARMLERAGHDAVTAENGEQTLELYRQALQDGRRFDCVILDLTVPGGMGGREAVQKLRELDPEVKAVVSSGYSEDQVCSDPRKYGFVGVISKPYLFNELVATLNRLFQAGQAEA